MAKNSLDIGSNDIYKTYVASLDSFEKKQGYLLPQKVINAAVFELNKRLVENMIMDNKFINLPYNLGTLAILKHQPTIKRKKNCYKTYNYLSQMVIQAVLIILGV